MKNVFAVFEQSNTHAKQTGTLLEVFAVQADAERYACDMGRMRGAFFYVQEIPVQAKYKSIFGA